MIYYMHNEIFHKSLKVLGVGDFMEIIVLFLIINRMHS